MTYMVAGTYPFPRVHQWHHGLCTCIASAPTHTRNSSASGWVGNFGFDSGTLDFDLGETRVVEQLALWNGTSNSASAIDSFSVFTADNAVFTGTTLVGTFNNLQNDAFDPYPVTVFDLTDSTVHFVRVEIHDNHGSTGPFGLTGFGEIAFDTTVAAVPEPATFGMLSLGAVGLLFRRCKVQTSA